MTYQDKVKAGKALVEKIKALGNDEYIVVTYGTDMDGFPKRYRIKCMEYSSDRLANSYSIHRDDVWAIDSMNISEFTNTMAKAYTYDMMGQRTTYNFPLYEMTIVYQPFQEKDHDLKF